MMNLAANTSLAWAVSALALASTLQARTPPSAASVEYFEKHIRPLLAERCYACHSARAEKPKGGLLLDSRSGWARGGDRGPAVVPGDIEASLLIRAVRYNDPDVRMPPDGRLPQEEIARLEHWIRIGAPDPRDAETTLSDSRGTEASDPVAGKKHWGFQPLTHHPPPTVDASDWPRSPIDYFILARLESANLRPAPDAEPRHFVRRIHFQLTGLPPTPKQVKAFLDDERPDAIERLLERLLNSPQFGERWGRHWLDLARYADSNGLDENFLFREAWRYRNWVLDAVNADMPYDRFILEQISGDILPYESIEQRDRQRIAAGFLVIGPKVLLGNDAKRQRMEVADEQIDTIGKAFLGQALGCARCHDHKFDPFPTADYYALAGIFTSTQVMESRYMLGQQRVMERLVGLGIDGDALNGRYEKYWRERPQLKKKIDQAKSVLKAMESGDPKALEALREKHADALAEGVTDTDRPIEQRTEAQKAFIARMEARLAKAPKIPARAMIPTDVEAPSDEHIRRAGQFDRLGDKVPRGFLRVLSTNSVARIPEGRSGRIELGRWLTDVEAGAGQLVARVVANRVWHHLIGRGIVRTPDNFGRTGDAPTHPALLDYLARDLIDSGWSIKALVRKIVVSRTFAMSSRHDEAGHALDPENRLLWRAHRRRLQPEALRDAMLAAAGQLDLTPMDSSVWYLGDQATAVGKNEVRRRTDFHCRSVYLPVIRNDLPELFDVFDFADPHATTGSRAQTTGALQGLFILNSNMVMDAAEATARRLLAGDKTGRPEALVDELFALILNVLPTDQERHELLELVRQAENHLNVQGDAEPAIRAWAMACHAVFALSRFQFLE